MTFEQPDVQSLARAEQIALVTHRDLETSLVLAELPENSFEVILFAEIIEHLTFNPVVFWRQVHRLPTPGGRIVATTPNY